MGGCARRAPAKAEIPSADVLLTPTHTGGWLQFYMFGVAKCLKEHGLHRQAKFSGCSAGALTALGMCIEPSSFDKAVVRTRVLAWNDLDGDQRSSASTSRKTPPTN